MKSLYLHKLVKASLITTYMLVVVWLILYIGFWTGYRDELLGKSSTAEIHQRLIPPRHVDSSTMLLLGSIQPSKHSHFVHFEQSKPKGTIRVCALGDSYTQGDEVGTHHDYPLHLQRRLEVDPISDTVTQLL